MSRILTITNFGDFQFIEQTREDNQIRHVPSNTFVSTNTDLSMYRKIATLGLSAVGGTVEKTLKFDYELRGGKYA